MAKYNGAFNVPGGFKIQNPTPPDDREVVINDADLLNSAQLDNIYEGIIVYSEESKEHYKWNGLDRTNSDNWVVLSSGGGSVSETPNKPVRVDITDPLTDLQSLGAEDFCAAATNTIKPDVVFEKSEIPFFSATYGEYSIVWTLNDLAVNNSFGTESTALTSADIQIISRTSLNEKVPYTGATQDVELGEFGLEAGYVKFDVTPTNTPTTEGTTFFNENDKALEVYLNGYKQVIGGDVFYPVKNQSNATIAKGIPVRFAGTLGASGRLLIEPFLANGSFVSSLFMGVTAEDIANGEEGKVLWFGRIRGLNTSSFSEGDILYASTTDIGKFQTNIPQAPNNIVQVAAVINSHATQGVIFVRPSIGSNINKDEGVKINNPTEGDILRYKDANGLFENIALDTDIVTEGTTNKYATGDEFQKPTDTLDDISDGVNTRKFLQSERDKLNGIEAGAEVNVQSDWNQTDNTADDFIKNKPDVETTTVTADLSASVINLNTSDLVSGLSQNGRRVLIDNGTSDVTVTVDTNITDTSYERADGAIGTITFVAATGQTLNAYLGVVEIVNDFDMAYLGSVETGVHRLRINTLE